MITVLFGGGREKGNTVKLTEHVLEGQDYKWIHLADVIESSENDDVNSDDDICRDFQRVTEQILSSEHVILVSPVNWYTISTTMQDFIKQFSEVLKTSKYKKAKTRLSDINFRLILIGGDSPRVKALPCVQQVDYSLQFLGAHLQDYLIGYAKSPGEISKDTYAMNEAAKWNEQYAAEQA
ncbi:MULTISPECIES: NAD(P)H-dependent oxidoreductase [unclassified Staphylococcus]|uniref:flavodoxin family protein n=1 Tax=unclassified Staphylococcus TaxID=91994 RepID=UPI0021D3D511|nr:MULTISPECIES: NAD(P)H-dependent oxidoreductase [unclassified Staphylococcus]UXR74210.1 NAD(P)H-dependent oxidoreductase [Staphylococcus sp. IVB6238]UXR76599.1 NAD(P)H-dependent oxidoreductase [Staphylococcus sp. IVB6233]UXR80727.1 NAD(P)H-dependent oxidoreductase [Staphylococcus sp. IVB6218]